MHHVVQQMAQEYKVCLQKLYGDDLVQLILFGSYARGDYHEESDVDFAVVLRNTELRPTTEIFKTSPIASQLSLKYGLMLSTLPVSQQKKEVRCSGSINTFEKKGYQYDTTPLAGSRKGNQKGRRCMGECRL